MPLTDFQKGIARLIAANRTPESHVAGGAVINRGETGLRISDDLDVFHDVTEGCSGDHRTRLVSRDSVEGLSPTIQVG